MKKSSLPTAVLLGRANVGKSTLFNTLTETSEALVSPTAGTTRDRREGTVIWRGTPFQLIDTGGLMESLSAFDKEVRHQAERAVKDADVILFMGDAKVAPLAQDRDMLRWLRTLKKPVLVAVNKAETRGQRLGGLDAFWYRTGFGDPYAVTALHGNGVGDLLDALYEKFSALGKPSA